MSQLEMFSRQDDAESQALFVMQHHWGSKLTAARKVIVEGIGPSIVARTLHKTPCEHGTGCVSLRCITAKWDSIAVGRRCPLCRQWVTLGRVGSQFVANYICPVGSVPKERKAAASGGYVYFVLDEGNQAVKIGYSIHPPLGRLRDLQVGHPSELRLLGHLRGPQDRERELHEKFRRLHLRGEWFRHEGALAKFIKSEARGR